MTPDQKAMIQVLPKVMKKTVILKGIQIYILIVDQILQIKVDLNNSIKIINIFIISL